jgi:hypothetical protein
MANTIRRRSSLLLLEEKIRAPLIVEPFSTNES